LRSRGLSYVYFSSFNRLAQLELVDINMFKLYLKSLSCLSNNANCLLVVTVDNWSDASVKVKLVKEIILLYKF
jgi:hypothetical protein